MNNLSFIAIILMLAFLPDTARAQDGEATDCAPWLDHSIQQLHSDERIDLCQETAGKPLLLVNTASYCGYTYQFTGLEELHQRYREQGLVVIGFPSDSFNQEDEDAAATAEVCYVNHGVTFLMTEVIEVTGTAAHPLFRHLTAMEGRPSWNFNKYLVNRQGEVVGHFSNQVEPGDPQLLRAIDALL